ncbi:splicing regulator SDE2 [Solea solea]|uniref:splicing regulator SDE2 n=1 Tax=Solea solea TaxID=90069 RepID=UPI00272CEADD|nr:splicing regulator SDE2 [Solea solea]
MEVYVNFARLRSSSVFPDGSVVKDVLTRFVQLQGVSYEDFYVIRNGRRSDLEDPVQHGAVYHLQPRLCGGKGGFGSMLRALGAQIEKTTNREACRDLSGRRLRDVNHEKEMADWLKKQAEREAEKEQRRVERLQRKLSEPKHQFTDPQYQRQCHDLSERLEESVLKGLQASSSGQVKVDEASAAKRPNQVQSGPQVKKKKTEAAAVFWAGLDELSSEDDDDESPSTSSRCDLVTMETQMEEVEPDQSSRSSPAESTSSVDQEQNPAESTSSVDQEQNPAESTSSVNQEQNPAESTSAEDQNPAESTSSEDQNPAESTSSEDQNPAESTSSEDQNPAESTSSEDQNPAESQQQSVLDASMVSVDAASSVQQLESLGLDVLKKELMSRGLKCGGTLSERAARLFSVRGLRPDQVDPALLAKPGKSRRK